MADSYRYDRGGKENQENSRPNGQSYNYHYKYSYGSGSGRGSAPPGGSKPPQQDNGWGEWIGIAVLLLFFPSWLKVFGVIWLVRKLVSMDAKQKNRYKKEAENAANRARQAAESFFQQADDGPQQKKETRQTADSARQQTTYQYGQPRQEQEQPKAERKAQPDGWNVRDPAENRRQKAQRQAKKDSADGKGLIIGGGIMSAIFALGTAAVSTDYFRMVFSGLGLFNDELVGLLACMMFLAGGLGMLLSGIGMSRRSERYMNYLAYIGANREVPLAHMAATFDVSVNKLCRDLRRMLSKGILPTGYLDLAEGKLYLTEMGYHAPEPKREAPPEETAQEAAAREDDILREIRQVNDEIPDAVMSAKIDRIEEITGKILKYQKAHPNKEGQLRTFLNYYLPTTLKVLRAYAQLDAQGIEGENISAAKKRIEDMMDQVVYGFEKQLDKLFQDDAMDITSDVEVLENMLKKDGLSDEGGITMTL